MNYIQFKNKVLNYFKDLPLDKVNQNVGSYREECGCCIGAHLAHLLFQGTSHEIGSRTFFRHIQNHLNIDGYKTGLFFHQVNGNMIYMFGTNNWSDHPYKILKRMFYLMDGEK